MLVPIVPEVSVVIGVRNGERHLARALSSICAQAGVLFELIVVDDGSTDSSGRISAEFAARDPRVRAIRQEGSGLTRALIRGCAEARGEFIARQDADDLSRPGRLLEQTRMLRSNRRLSFVSSSVEMIGPNDEVLYVNHRPSHPESATKRLLAMQAGPVHGSVMFRKSAYEAVGGYRPELYFAQDNDLWLRLGSVGQLDYAQDVFYQLRISPESISGSLHPIKLPFAQIVHELYEARRSGRSEADILERARMLPVTSTGRGRRDSSADSTNYFIGRCLLNRSDRRALPYLLSAVRLNPLNLRAWLSLPHALLLRARRSG